MKTLLFTLEFPPFKGGVANYYGNLANYWPIDEKLLILDNHLGELKTGSGFFSWRPAFGALARKIKKSQIDYVLVGQILPLGTVAWWLSLFRPFKYGVFLHGMDLTWALSVPRKKMLVRLILGRADKIICANSYTADKAKEYFPALEEKITVINPGIISQAPAIDQPRLEELKATYNLEGKTVIFSLGRLVKRKGFDATIKALALVPEPLIDNLLYVIAGVGPDEMYLKKLVPPALANKIIFLGGITDDEKWRWLAASSFFIMPSRDIDGDFEGFGIVYLEANLSGKAVIAGQAGGVRDAVVDGYNGLVVDAENIESLKDAIINLATDPELRNKLGEQGKVRAMSEFNWEKQVEKISDLIKRKA